jgi:hypothetical protein
MLVVIGLAPYATAGSKTTSDAPQLNACGCYRNSVGVCLCPKRGECECPGECEARGCSEKRKEELDREIQAEAKQAKEAEKKRQEEEAEKQGLAQTAKRNAELEARRTKTRYLLDEAAKLTKKNNPDEALEAVTEAKRLGAAEDPETASQLRDVELAIENTPSMKKRSAVERKTASDNPDRPRGMGPLEDILPVFVGESWEEASARVGRNASKVKGERGAGLHRIGGHVNIEGPFGTIEYLSIESKGADLRVSEIDARLELKGSHLCGIAAIKQMAGPHWNSWKQTSIEMATIVNATWPGERSLRGSCWKERGRALHTVVMNLSDSWTQMPTNQRNALLGTVVAGRLVRNAVDSWLAAAEATGESVNGMRIADDIQDGFLGVKDVGKLSPRARKSFDEYRALTNNVAWVLGQISLEMKVSAKGALIDDSEPGR